MFFAAFGWFLLFLFSFQGLAQAIAYVQTRITGPIKICNDILQKILGTTGAHFTQSQGSYADIFPLQVKIPQRSAMSTTRRSTDII